MFNQFLALLVHLILRVEQGTPLLVALGFKSFDLLLPGEFFLQRQGGGGGAAGIFDLAVNFLDFPFEPRFQVVGPAVEFVGLGFEEAGVAFGNVALDGGLAILGEGFELLRDPTLTPALSLREREYVIGEWGTGAGQGQESCRDFFI